MSDIFYKRNQVEEALWSVFASRHGSTTEVPPAFVTRIKRLLEIDRTEPVSRGSHYAFSEGPAGGKGTDSVLTEFNCACLTTALEMLDIGFKQREIVLFLRAHRKTLAEEIRFMNMLGDGHPSRRKEKVLIRKQRKDEHDARLYMLVPKLERSDDLPGLASPTRPFFAHGLKELSEKLDRLTRKGQLYRSYVVMEIGTMIDDLLVRLFNSTEKKRGRP